LCLGKGPTWFEAKRLLKGGNGSRDLALFREKDAKIVVPLDELRRKLDCLPVRLLRILQLFLIEQGAAEIHVRDGELRINPNCLTQFGLRLLRFLEVEEDNTEVTMSSGPILLEVNRFTKGLFCGGQLVLFPQGIAQICESE